jgi:hypothetical protein
MVFGGLNLFGSMSSGHAGDGTNKEESIKQIGNHDAHDDNKNKQINNDETSSTNNATANSDKLDDAAALKNHKNMECKQTEDSAPSSSPDSQQSKQDATTSNADKHSSTVTVTREATQQEATSSESDDKITGLGSVLKGVGTSSCATVDYVVEKQRTNMLPSKMSSISNASSTDTSLFSTSDSTDTASTEEQPKKSDTTQEQASKKTASKENEESASMVDGVSQQLKNKKSTANQTPTIHQLRTTGGMKKKSLLIEVLGINGLLEFRDVPADGNCMIHALNEVCLNVQKNPWKKLCSEMVKFAAEGKLYGIIVLNHALINT